MENTLLDAVSEEFRCWIENHPNRAEQALEGLADTNNSALIDLANLISKALGKD